MDRHDAIVIGAGHNGLTAACVLAKAGRKVLVLERASRLGGAAFGELRADGFLFSSEGYASRLLEPHLIRDLDLARFGLAMLPTRASYAIDAQNKTALVLHADAVDRARGIAAVSPRDAERFEELAAMVQRQAEVLRPLRAEAGRATRRFSLRAKRRFQDAAVNLASQGNGAAYEAATFWAASLGDILDQYLENSALKALIAVRALAGIPLGPYAPGTASRLLEFPGFAGDTGAHGLGCYVAGGASALADALAATLREMGGEVRLETPVSAILLENGRAAGVVLESGDEVRTGCVLSSLDVKRTFLTLFEWETLPKPFLGRVAKVQASGCVAKLDLALDQLPEVPALPQGWHKTPGDIVVSGGLREIEGGYRDWAAQMPPRRTPLILSFPSLIDSSRAPRRQHVLSVFAQYVPETLFDGPWSSDRRESFAAQILEQLGTVIPGLADHVRDLRLLLPSDIETETGITGGSVFHVDEVPAQLLFNQPAPEAARYATVVPGLYLCGAGTHPGGGLTGEPGARAARVVDAALGQGRRR